MSITPQMRADVASFPNLHTPFLERASEHGNRERAHALGAFLVLRAADRIAEDPSSDGLPYQLRAARNYLDQLHPHTQEVSHLREIIRVAEQVATSGSRRLMWAPLLAFGYWLENELRLDESFDVLQTSLGFSDGGVCAEETGARLQLARVLKQAGRFAESTQAYDQAATMAHAGGDWRSEMVSKIGRAGVKQRTGDLRLAETELRSILEKARGNKDTFIEARALHDLAVNANLMKRTSEAVTLAFRASELYDEPSQRLRALQATGVFLKELGHYSAARDAFSIVMESDPSKELQLYTMIELLDVASLVSDQLGFERWRKELDSRYDLMPSHERVDFGIRVASGLTLFGATQDAVIRLERVIELAQTHGLGQRLFEAESMMNAIRAGTPLVAAPHPSAFEDSPELQSTIQELSALRTVGV